MLKVTFFDAAGVMIEEFVATPSEALERISRFVEIHAVWPDETGQPPQAGSVAFTPVTPV